MGNDEITEKTSMPDEIYWIWLQQALGIGSIKVDKVLQLGISAKTFFEMDEPALMDTGFLLRENIYRIKNTPISAAERMYERAQKVKCKVITPESLDYPINFTNIHCQPCVLYVLGDLSVEVPLSITIVGTRKYTPHGENITFQLSRDLASVGCQIVSGMAVGIDQAAHRGALAGGGRTVSFLACGMNVDYPSGSARLKRQILNQNGVLVTEFPFDSPAKSHHFSIRNRLLSGISDGTLVAQAPSHSGALMTAHYALDQNREVFAVPGDISDLSMVGCNQLLKEGCTIVTSIYSVLEVYFDRFSKKQADQITQAIRKPLKQNQVKCVPKSIPLQEPPNVEKLIETLSETARSIYDLLGEDSVDCNLLACRSEKPVSGVVAALTELEMTGLVTAESGRRYKKVT